MMDTDGKRIRDAMMVAYKYAQTDGGHHRLWVIDQMVVAGEVKGFATREDVIGHCEVMGFTAPYREERW